MSKRVLGLLLALVMVLTMLPFGAAAAEEKSYPATRIGLCELAYDLFDGSAPEEVQLPFVDLDGLSEHQLEVVRWALTNHITVGTDETHFAPNMYVTNGMVAAILYRAAGQPEVTTTEIPYYDVGSFEYYSKPAQWCAEHDLLVIQGTEPGQLLPNSAACSFIVQKGEDIDHSKVTINMNHVWDEGVITTAPSVPATGTEPGYALYHCKNCEHEIILVRTPALGDDALAQQFTDVAADQYYAEPVDWAVRRGVTNGTGAGIFTPDGTCTRAQVVTFLWRAYGCPEPETKTVPFVDVEKGTYYTDAVLWANENGITNGTDKEHFSPENPCTRAHVVTFLWRAEYEGQGAYFGTFEDVDSPSEYYFTAVYWANLHGITNGTDATHFSPHAPCTRGQIVTFIYRAFSEPVTFIFYEG